VIAQVNSTFDTLVVSAIQMVSTDCPEQNFLRACLLLEEAVAVQKSNLVIFPENFLCFSSKEMGEHQAAFSDYISQFKALAAKYSIALVLGSIPIKSTEVASGERFYSRCYVINHLGEIASTYDKIHLFDVDVADSHARYRESDHFSPGERVVVSDMGSASLGLSICYDLRFAELYRCLAQKGANIIVVPAAFTSVTGEAQWEVLLRARAIENQCFVVAANQGGTHSSGRETWGESMIIDPWGRVLSRCGKGEGVCTAELDLNQVISIRQSMNIKDHRRLI